MDLALRDAVVLVTGAGQGLGRAIGLAFAREGAHVAFHYHSSAEGAEAAATEARALGVKALVVGRRKSTSPSPVPCASRTPSRGGWRSAGRELATPLSSWTTGQVVSVNGGYAMA